MKKLGEILIEQGVLTSKQLDVALARQKNDSGKLLGEILIELGFGTEEDIVAALSTQFNIPYLAIRNFALDESLKQQIPEELIQKHLFIPLDKIGDLLMIVVADPTNEQAIREVERATNCRVRIFVSTVTEIKEIIQQHFHKKPVLRPSTNKATGEETDRLQTTHKK